MQWIRKRLLEILCVMIYFTVNPLSTSGLRPLRLCHLLSAPNSGSTEENNKASHGATQSQKKMMDPLFSLEEIRRSCYICLRACLHGGVGDPRLVR